MNTDILTGLERNILNGRMISADDAEALARLSGNAVYDLFAAANRIRHHYQGNTVDLCAIVNAKSGKCPEDCSYCAQSSKSLAKITSYPLLEKETVIAKAGDAKKGGAKRFCIVTSGRTVSGRELNSIADMISAVRSIGLLPCATLGLLTRDDLILLKSAGLERFHNNLETSERFFPMICSTHTYQDKVRTIRNAQDIGLSVCSGGIFGLGESWKDRIDMALALRELGPDSVPINYLTQLDGIRLGSREPLDPFEALKIISIYRFILPQKHIRICGGRLQTLGQLHPLIFQAGASGLLIGNYLTTLGRGYAEDLKLIRQFGLVPA
jgi:biotin synthase